MTRLLCVAIAALVIAASFIAFSTAASAHETRNVGPYVFVVGWLNEPAIQGQPNAATVRITDPRVTPAKAVLEVEKTLTIRVFSGGLTTPYTGTVRAVFGQPGLYALDVIPTAAGGYRYQLTGKVEALDVNETFESGPGRFNDVQAATSIQFPDRVPGGGDLARELEQLRTTADQTRLFTIVALVVALAALALTLMRRRV
ncbi:MAG TPA: hypothetical protein VJP45_08070 [Candidatus Limnocylindria bacterium]|nr:hypothetical protein [Candidatus Limnocylindria bacterium]